MRYLICHIEKVAILSTTNPPSPFSKVAPSSLHPHLSSTIPRSKMSSSISLLLDGGQKIQLYTPKTYGVAGAKIKGFHVDDILLPGSQIDVAEINHSTWYLLKFHLLRAILSLIFFALELFRGFPLIAKQAALIQLRVSGYNKFDEVVKETIGLESKARPKDSIMPRHVGVVLKHFPIVTEPGRDISNADDLLFYEKESQRMAGDVTELIYWCARNEIPTLTIYEQTGFLLEQNMESLLTNCSMKIDAAIKIHARTCNSTASFVTETPSLSGEYQLNVYLFQRNETKRSLLRAVQKICRNIEEGQLSASSVGRTDIDGMVRKFELGVDEPLDLVILTGPNGATQGFPIYSTGGAVVYHDMFHKWSITKQMLSRALAEYTRANSSSEFY